MKAVYIASPYTQGSVSDNVRNSLDDAEELIAYGFLPFCPLLSHFWDLIIKHEYDFWMSMDFGWVERCDAVLRLPGESGGADKEVEHATKCGIPVYFSLRDLVEAEHIKEQEATE